MPAATPYGRTVPAAAPGPAPAPAPESAPAPAPARLERPAPAAPAGGALIVAPAGPRPEVAGLGLVERWRAALREAGLAAEVVEPGALAAALAGHAAPVHAAPVLVCDGGAVMGAAAVAELARARCDAGEVVTAAPPQGVPPGAAQPAPALVLGARVARRVARRAAADAPGAARAAARLAAAGAARPRAVAVRDPLWGTVAGEADARRMTWAILSRLRLRQGGWVARNLNRRVSLRITRRLLGTRVTPDQMTMIAASVGVLGVALIALGGYALAVAGGALLQASSILDGVDGELARARHRTTARGAWLDSILDEVVNALLYPAVGLHAAAATGRPHLAWLGLFAGAVSALYAAVHWHCKTRRGLGFYWWWDLGRPRGQVQADRSWRSDLKKLFWRETTLLLVFAAAVAGALPALTWVLAAGAAVTLTLLVWHIGVRREAW